MDGIPHSMQKLDFELDEGISGKANPSLNTTFEPNDVQPSLDISGPSNRNDDLPTSKETVGIDTSIQNKVREKLSLIPEKWTPKIGMIFPTVVEAYDFYNTYAGKVGFSIRKASRSLCKRSNQVRYSKFCCSREGKRKANGSLNAKIHRPETRCGCMAAMTISRVKDGYRVIGFNETHNHMFATPMKSHMLRSQRRVNDMQAKMANDVGIAPKAIMEREVDGHENVGLTSVDLKNYLHSHRTRNMEKGEASGILQYFEDRQSQDPSFVYAIQLDQAELVTNMFWADAQMIVDYFHFGDVVSFDTTYRTNKENRPLAVFVGVNNYRQTIIFGAALLYDETMASFVWLFEVFLKTMGGKQPLTILTDDDATIEKAINLVLPKSHHRLCVWHMFQNAAKHLSGVFEKFKLFSQDFKRCVYEYDDVDEFESAWKNMIDKYRLQENEWLQKLYNKKHKWALVYGRQTFSAGMSITQRSESLNNCLKKYLNIKHDLSRFLQHFERVVADKQYEESKAEFAATQSTPFMVANMAILDFASRVYTPPIFSIFQNEVLQQLNCRIEDECVVSETSIEYTIHLYGVNRQYKVTFDPRNNSVNCSCRNFEFVGILCRHALKILEYRHVEVLPSCHVLRRWTINAKKSGSEASHGHLDQARKMAIHKKELFHLFTQIVNQAAPNDDAYKIAMQLGEKILEEVTMCLKQATTKQSFVAFDGIKVDGSPYIDDGTQVETNDTQMDTCGTQGEKDINCNLRVTRYSPH
ncbi:PREDICTED: protein FAR1-RELATED SEQUENCE 5-like [Nelumbo nucifera]|uniref:Protein FAR1-RELATED SEQUENCE n=1 Tax=Nelumbo nucifera TaxID=4432 RepID=A0A1U8B5M2_NELNU|nr:PREDICTED: protein FAR1-RELATED SEQUENCE 5-like [Nelumbo nucifera]XP_010271482.1 PREDICTED: protein FAR1-RELATED SEQUENCE 5-like [Nelumbo nucifera]